MAEGLTYFEAIRRHVDRSTKQIEDQDDYVKD
jgi:hypothetical protein